MEIDVSDIFSFSAAVPAGTVSFPHAVLPGEDYISLHFVTDPLGKGRIPDRAPLARPESVTRYVALRYGVRDQGIIGARAPWR